MGTIAEFAIDAGAKEIAACAVHWLGGFTPHVQATLSDTRVRLQSDQHDHPDLAAIWAAALANEVSHQRAQAHRAGAYRMLAQ
ncbi:hypothetical protein RZN05_02480 [Sphingomonas sp. HF-S4]|uniref:Uncharacterized protein n=1 Tax=Sphingomonas agrestis TaxID=3080540 RepID=A0ABU3Y369_9SPHN|nr:hypothetical protein [Sphingomonas sp. HF-S4]MDV3455836.1 hypothetical protein [Sphingomonas sp. HF-S4]